MQVCITVAEVTGGGATGRACDDNNPHFFFARYVAKPRRSNIKVKMGLLKSLDVYPKKARVSGSKLRVQ